ncbi:major facilitator superfamily domain-containing protein, putative [Plasmodium vinckei petteri]|uniref:Major facilitator superfamily domain-containing protein, putative n=1 Tax=Plasmodium vinckei petteri TaxID=138298 RepID=A0A6V7TAA9_PLAVN|nr:major facilitator superfamily domain-containing protein, putative [Plasmodium vinckei petteri]
MKLLRDHDNLFYENEEYEKIRKKTLFKILLSVFIKTLFESFLQPLLPFYILNYYKIEVKELGILLSFYSFSQCVMCLIIGLFSSINKKHLLVFLILFNLVGIYLFYIKLNFTLLVINRIICGCSSVFVVVVNAIINDLVDTNVCTYYTYINIFNAIGIILGPLLSSFFLTIFNFEIILNFNTLGLISSLLIILTISSELLSQNKYKTPAKLAREYKLNQDNKNDNKLEEDDNANTWITYKNYNKHGERDKLILNKYYKKGDAESINNEFLNNKTNYSETGRKGNIFNYYNDDISDKSYQQFLRRTDYLFISKISRCIKNVFNKILSVSLTYKSKCLLSICLLRFSASFSSNLMNNIFFVFYNDNVSSGNKQIQISLFVSLSGIIMICYQYFSFSFILRNFGYNGTAVIGLIIQSTGVLLTYNSIKYYNLIFQYISICFIHSCSYAYIEPIIPTIISLFFDKKDQLFTQSIVSFFRYLSLTISPIIYSYYYIENQLFPFFISSCMSIVSIFFVFLSFKYYEKMIKSTQN